MGLLRILAIIVVLCAVAAVGVAATAWRSAIDPVPRPSAKSFDEARIARGAELAAIGNCNTCHTVPDGRSFAGGLGVQTPFGIIYSSNITPDESTGIGSWSEAAFRRALREGVDREGEQLYPAFPYDHFTLLSDDDISALYAFFMTRAPVRQTAPPNELPFPFNVRLIVAGWKLLFLRQGPYQPDPSQSEAWNHGAYLVKGLAHCGACHTPRNVLGAENKENAFGGGDVEGWTAYALNEASPAPVPWSVDALRAYLRNGWQSDHGIASGPMAAVIDNLAAISDSDLAAVTTYMAGVLGEPSAERKRAADALVERVRLTNGASSGSKSSPPSPSSETEISGARIYEAACATCHESGRSLPYGGIDLALSTGPSSPDPRNVINVVLWGLPAVQGERSPIMPGFANMLSDQQLADVLGYVRSHFGGNKPAWTDINKDIREARSRGPLAAPSAHGTDPANAIVSQHEAQR